MAVRAVDPVATDAEEVAREPRVDIVVDVLRARVFYAVGRGEDEAGRDYRPFLVEGQSSAPPRRAVTTVRNSPAAISQPGGIRRAEPGVVPVDDPALRGLPAPPAGPLARPERRGGAELLAGGEQARRRLAFGLQRVAVTRAAGQEPARCRAAVVRPGAAGGIEAEVGAGEARGVVVQEAGRQKQKRVPELGGEPRQLVVVQFLSSFHNPKNVFSSVFSSVAAPARAYRQSWPGGVGAPTCRRTCRPADMSARADIFHVGWVNQLVCWWGPGTRRRLPASITSFPPPGPPTAPQPPPPDHKTGGGLAKIWEGEVVSASPANMSGRRVKRRRRIADTSAANSGDRRLGPRLSACADRTAFDMSQYACTPCSARPCRS